MPKFSVKNAASRGVDRIACEDGVHAFRNFESGNRTTEDVREPQ